MNNGMIKNREPFLNNVSKALNRERRTNVVKPRWKHAPQYQIFKDATQDELSEILKSQCKNIHTTVHETMVENLSIVISDVISNYEGKSICTWKDPRFEEYGLEDYFKTELPSKGKKIHIWDHTAGNKNMEFSKSADVGITFSDITLAESGTVVLFSSAEKGRSVSLLPATYIAIIPKSTIVPRMTQVAREVHKQIQQGKQVASCVNFISGPSNSADIEMELIVGVHGPIKATYIIVLDK
ncbi:LutC/YkgG family protein [Bacillus sp. Marseille-P3661]|uniref:LutC/YkgG family protein n=1 Tax=Bacillus sp. Marseille-P3661 TaxID=1936234 RepID=UPI000C8523AD|nr:lactate utilization protein C [Bacillus sp. Marseille-P3661]